jgi:hypothetical protein
VTDAAASSSAVPFAEADPLGQRGVLPVGEVADHLPQLLLLFGELEAEPGHWLSPCMGPMTSSPNRASAVSVAS